MGRIIKYLMSKKNISIKHEGSVTNIQPVLNGTFIVELLEQGQPFYYKADNIVIATGRAGTKWLNRLAHRLDLKVQKNSVDVGIRIDMPIKVLTPYLETLSDPKFKIDKGLNSEVRTFCACIGGKITQVNLDGVKIVDGHFGRYPTQNANIAIMNRMRPLKGENGYECALDYAERLNIGGKPIIQTLGDFKTGLR